MKKIGKLKETEVEQPGHWSLALSASVAGAMVQVMRE